MTHADQDTLRMDCTATLSISPLDYSSPPLPYCECTVSLSLVPGDSFTLSGRNNSGRDHKGRKERVFHVNLAKAKSYGLRGTSHRIGMENGQFFFLDFSDDDDYKAFLPFLRLALDSLDLKDRPAPPAKPREDYLVSPRSASNGANADELSKQEDAKENPYLSLRYSMMDLAEEGKDSDNDGYEELRSPNQLGSKGPISASNRLEQTDVRFKTTGIDQSPERTDPNAPKIPPRSLQSLRNPIYNHSIDRKWSPSPDSQKTARNMDSAKNRDMESTSSSPSLSSTNHENFGIERMINTLPIPKRQNREQCQIDYSNTNRFQSSRPQPVIKLNDKKSKQNGCAFALPKPDRSFQNIHGNVSQFGHSPTEKMNSSPKNFDNMSFIDRARSLTPTLHTYVKDSSGSNHSDSPRFRDHRKNVFVTRETNRSDQNEISSADDLESIFNLSVSMPLLNHRGGRGKTSKANNFTPINSFQRQVSEPSTESSHNQSQTPLSRNISFTILDGQKTRNIMNVSHDGVAVIFEMEMEMSSAGYSDGGRKRKESSARTCEDSWTCSVCTYDNECSTDLCVICDASRLK